MALPKLNLIDVTISGLHRAALLAGLVQTLTQSPQPAYLELALNLDAEGFSTGLLPAGGRVRINLQNGLLIYQAKNGKETIFEIHHQTQAALFCNLFGTLSDYELPGGLPAGGSLFERVSKAVASRGDRYHAPEQNKYLDDSLIELDAKTCRDYLSVLQVFQNGISRFQSHLLRVHTPIVLWPHGFDLSTLIFKGQKVDETLAHVNLGFSPGSAGISFPYFYAYAYPYPEDYKTPILPDGAYWQTEGWNGVVLPYEYIGKQADPVDYIEKVGRLIFDLLP